MGSEGPEAPPVGAVLAGGEGRRIGGDKAIVELEGRPLVSYPLEALHEVCDRVAVVAKRQTLLPPLEGAVELWLEPDEQRDPLCGLVHALRVADGSPVLALACDLPLVDGDVLRALLAAARGSTAPAVAPRVHDRLEPLCALYRRQALPDLERALEAGARMSDAVAALRPDELAVADDVAFLNVDRPEDLLRAATLFGC